MASNINSFPVPLPTDLSLRIFSHVPRKRYADLSTVCREWKALLDMNLLWEPVLQEILPKTYQNYTNNLATSSLKAVVSTFFIKSCADIQFIVNLIKDDDQLAKCLGMDRWTLEGFKDKSPFERSRLFWKAICQDATPIFVTLLQNVRPRFRECILTYDGEPSVDRDAVSQQRSAIQKATSIVGSFIHTHAVPFDAPDVICALLPFIHLNPNAEELIISFIKSHINLSGLKGKHFIPLIVTSNQSALTEVLIVCKRSANAVNLSINTPVA
jgi:hypothetical protein